MNINCVICSDLFSQSDEIYSTHCGHIFHQSCLLQWLERSPSCPQCRKKTTEKNIWKIFFNFLNTEGITLDVGSLQVQLDNAELQIREKNKSICSLTESTEKLQAKCEKLDETVLNLKDKLKTKELALSGLREQIDYLKCECQEIKSLRNSNEILQKQIDLMKGLQEVINGTSSEVEQMVNSTTDVSKLSTYIVVLKRAVMDSELKKKMARDNLQVTQNQMSKLAMEKHDLQAQIRLLEESLSHSEDEIKELKTQILERESPIMKPPICNSIQNLKRKNDSLNLESNKKLQLVNSNASSSKDSPLIKENIRLIQESKSPYLNVKQCGNPLPIFLKKSLSDTFSSGSKSNDFSIFRATKLAEKIKSESDSDVLKKIVKKTESEASYNGLGGHSKLDMFPVSSRIAVKKPNMKSIMKRVERPSNQKTLNESFKKLL